VRYHRTFHLAIALTLALMVGPISATARAQVQTPPLNCNQSPLPAGCLQYIGPALSTNPAPGSTFMVGGVAYVKCNGILVPDGSCAADQPAIKITSCSGPDVIVQGCNLDPSLSSALGLTLQNQAIGEVLRLHQLPPEDATRVLVWERNLVRAALFEVLVGLIQKPPATRSADEQRVLEQLAGRVKEHRIAAARNALVEYTKWTADPCRYSPPAGFAYDAGTNCGPPGGLASLFGNPLPPAFAQFQAYGVSLAYSMLSDPAYPAVSGGLARGLGILGGITAVAVGAGVVGANLAIGSALLTAVQPFLVSSVINSMGLISSANAATVAAVSGEAAGSLGALSIAGPATIVVTAVVIGVVHTIDVVNATDVPILLQGALDTATSNPVDLGTLIATDTGMREFFAVFVDATLPEYPSHEPVPGPLAGDRQFSVRSGAALAATNTPALRYRAWDGSNHVGRLADGWFVDTAADATSRLQLSIGYQAYDGTPWTASRVGNKFLHTSVNDPTATLLLSDRVGYIDADGNQAVATLAAQPAAPWIIGAASTGSGDYAILNRAAGASTWVGVDGAASRVAAARDGQPWVVNASGQIYRREKGAHGYADGSWRMVDGARATDVAVGADWSVWIIDTTPGPGGNGNGIARLMDPVQRTWKKIAGEAIAIAVGPDGQPWVVNKSGQIWRGYRGGPTNTYIDGGFTLLQGPPATDIALGTDGSAWIISTNPTAGGYTILTYAQSVRWESVSGGAVRIAVDGHGNPWVVNDQGMVWAYDTASRQWRAVGPGGTATDIGVGD
jgi:hypothetical protein